MNRALIIQSPLLATKFYVPVTSATLIPEGPPMAELLSRLREQQRPQGSTCYLDTLLGAFPQQSKAPKRQPKRSRQSTRRTS